MIFEKKENLTGELDSSVKKEGHNAENREVIVTKLYYGGRSFLIRLPTNIVRKLGLKPMDFVKVTVERWGEEE